MTQLQQLLQQPPKAAKPLRLLLAAMQTMECRYRQQSQLPLLLQLLHLLQMHTVVLLALSLLLLPGLRRSRLLAAAAAVGSLQPRHRLLLCWC
jgi:hypothetical protein